MDQEVIRTQAIPQTWDIHPPGGLCEPGDPTEGQEESVCILIRHGRHRMHELPHQHETPLADWHTTKHLTPTSMTMEAANHSYIDIIGSVVVRLSGQSPIGETLETRQRRLTSFF